MGNTSIVREFQIQFDLITMFKAWVGDNFSKSRIVIAEFEHLASYVVIGILKYKILIVNSVSLHAKRSIFMCHLHETDVCCFPYLRGKIALL